MDRVCGVDGCVRSYEARGYCGLHYQRLRTKGNPGPLECLKPGPNKYEREDTCSVIECERPPKARGWCSMHYGRVLSDGAPGEAESKIGPRGEGTINKAGYRQIKVNGMLVYEHRHVMEQMLERSLLQTESVHHKNNIKHDNRPENLELWSRVQPNGMRVSDLLAYVVDNYSEELRVLLSECASKEQFLAPS